MAQGDIVSQAKFYVDGPMGNLQLRRCKSADPKSDKDAEVVTAVGVDGGAGYRHKEGGGSIDLEVYEEQGVPEVNWRREMDRKTRFSFTIQYVGGMRWMYTDCIVASVAPKSDDAGSHMMSVKLLFLNQRQLASA